MLVREVKTRPAAWPAKKASLRRRWLIPLHAVEWAFEWVAYALSRWAFLEVLEYLGTLSVLVAVVFYFSEAGDRRKQKHYQAWQVINTAQGKGGNGGRLDALRELNADGVALAGVDLSNAFLQGLELRGANLLRADLGAADLRDSVLAGCNMQYANLRSANFRGANLTGVNLGHADLQDSDFGGATLARADLTHANLESADLRNADLRGVHWADIRGIKASNIYGVRNAPPGFVDWALQNGAVRAPSDE